MKYSWQDFVGNHLIVGDHVLLSANIDKYAFAQDGEAFIGVVGRNFYPGDWDVPLSQSKHAVVVDVNSGRFHHKGANTNFVLRCALFLYDFWEGGLPHTSATHILPNVLATQAFKKRFAN